MSLPLPARAPVEVVVRRRRVGSLVTAGVAGALLAIAIGFALGTGREEQWLLATRYTARFSFPVFLLAFTASALRRFFPGEGTRALVRERRGLGLSFAAAHTVHLGALVIYNVVAGRTPNLVTLAGGGVAYLAMYLMALTSNDWSVRRLGKNWGRLHTFGAYWIWGIFSFTYGTRVASGKLFFLPELVLALAALTLRLLPQSARR
jgi:methionine sulfoxide reductase heme-binding subunit